MTRWQEEDFDKVRSIVANYQAKYKDTAYDYLSILDMNDSDFRTVYQLTEESVAS